MNIVGSTDQPRSDHLGPQYSEAENVGVNTSEFIEVPIEAQPTVILKCYLLNRGVPTTENNTPERIRERVHCAEEVQKPVLDPSLALEPVKLVGFEPLDELVLGAKYGDWVSLCHSFARFASLNESDKPCHEFLPIRFATIQASSVL